MRPADGLIDRLLDACQGDTRHIRVALVEAGVQYVEDFPDPDFLVQRVRALAEEDIIYNWNEEHER